LKKIISVGLLLFVFLFTFAIHASAHPGRTDAKGGHTCRTNCEKWGLKYGEYHYHTGGSNSSNNTVRDSNTNSSSKSSYTQPQKKAAYQSADVTVYFNGEKLNFDTNPIKINNTILVSMRKIFEALNASVQWDASSQTVTATKDDTEIKITIGSNTAYINGSSVSLVEPAVIVDGSTMVPLRFVSESLGATVEWDNSTQPIKITN